MFQYKYKTILHYFIKNFMDLIMGYYINYEVSYRIMINYADVEKYRISRHVRNTFFPEKSSNNPPAYYIPMVRFW